MRHFAWWQTLLLLTLSLLSLAACHDDDIITPQPQPQPQPADSVGRRTVLVYMAAQNTLGGGHWHQSDSIELMRGRQYLADDDRLLLFVDDNRAPRLYRIASQWSEPQLIKQWGQDICSTSPRRFAEVVQMAHDSFPAREFALSMWSHADGWLPPTNTNYADFESQPSSGIRPQSFGIDSGPNGKMSDNGAQMSVEDMAHVLDSLQVHCRYIFFDCCLMQNLEVDYALRHVCDYVIASPMSIHSAGAYYEHMLRDGLFATDPSVMAQTYYRDVADSTLQAQVYGNTGIAISCVRTDQLQPLADALRAALQGTSVEQLEKTDMTGVLAYQAYNRRFSYRPHNYDALQALERIVPAERLASVRDKLDAAVVSHYSTPSIYLGPGVRDFAKVPIESDHFRAVSMFVPQEIYSDNASFCPYGDLNAAFLQTEWGRTVMGLEAEPYEGRDGSHE